MFGKSAFGGGGGFGQQPQQSSVFGQQQQQPQQQQQSSPFGGGGFGAGATGGAFGSAANTSTGAFGQAAQPSAFGSGGATGFGGNTGSAFGQARPSAFGGSSAFGSGAQQQQPSTGFGAGGFGASSAPATSGFGAGANTQAAGGGGLFGQNRTSAFGQPATSTTGGVFGGGAATSSAPGAFGQQTQQSAFGAGGGMGGSAFGAQQGAPGGNQGTAVADFTATTDRDIATGTNNFFQTITAMPQYRSYSLEELRLQDYAQNRKNSGAAGAPAAGGFGSTATGGFGAGATGGFGQQQQQPGSTPFGQSAGTGAFGQQQQQPAAGGFGAGATGGGLFGQQQQQQQGTPAFGSSATGGFGAGATGGGFGATSATTGGFGSAGGFGATAGNAAKPLFGGSQPATGGFGAASTTPAFGAGATTGGFGQPNQQQQAGGFGGGFGAKPSGTATTGGFGQTAGGFGTATGGFGSTATNKPASSFSFNTPGTQTGAGATTGGFGAGGFGAQQPATGGFGGAGAQQTSLFGANKPATSAPLFGGGQPATGGFGIGTGGTAGATGGFGSSSLFNQKPATGGLTGGTGLFNNQSTTGGFGGGFGTQPQGTSSFTLPATGGLTSFGAQGLQPGQQQQPMIATVDNKPYGSNPLFDTTKIGATATSSTTNGANKQGPSAVALDSSNKKPTSAHRPMAPRVVSKIKLRGFSLGPAGRTSPSKKMSSLEGLSDDAVLGPNAFSTRSANKKLVFEKDVDTADIASLLTKKDEKPSFIFDPKLEMIARKKELEREKQQASASSSKSTSLVGAGVSTSSSASNIPAPAAPVRGESGSSSVGARFVSNSAYSATTTSQGYYSSPTLETLQSMTNEELKHVDNFMVGRRGYGEVRFDEPVDLSGLDLYDIMGTIVILEEKSVVIYPDESTKAPRGAALNVPATVKLENCYALDKESRRPIKDPENPRFRSFYDRLRNRQGVEFVDYDIETGTWSFKVEFF